VDALPVGTCRSGVGLFVVVCPHDMLYLQALRLTGIVWPVLVSFMLRPPSFIGKCISGRDTSREKSMTLL
jgi:hypothetical protein